MKLVKIYEYPNCSTCKKALKFLANHNRAVEKVNIFETPPTPTELREMVKAQQGNFKKLFNTAGQVYKEQGLAEKVKSFTEDDAIALLSKNGRLVKRPFVLFEGNGLVGFDEKQWKSVFK